MMKKYGLILTGGGGKGAFQIGALKALKEAGMTDYITGVSGASIGVINACLFCEGKIELAQKIWKNIEPIMFLEPDIEKGIQITSQAVYSVDWLVDDIIKKYEEVIANKAYEKFARNHVGAFSRDGLIEMMEKNIDFNRISLSPISFYADVCNCVNDRLEIEYIKLNGKTPEDIKKLILASSALPYVYDAIEYEGKIYRDGGILDNVPITPLYNEGYRDFIVIGLKKDYGIDYSKFSECNFTFIMPSHSIGGFVDGTMDFSKEGARFRMALGYRNASRVISAVKSGKINEPDYEEWFESMSQLDYEAAKQDVRQEELFEKKDEHMDKLLSIYNKYM